MTTTKIVVASAAAVVATWIIFAYVPGFDAALEQLAIDANWGQLPMVAKIATPAVLAAGIVALADDGKKLVAHTPAPVAPLAPAPQTIVIEREAPAPRMVSVETQPPVVVQAPAQPRIVQAPTRVQRYQRAGRAVDQRGAAVLRGLQPVVNMNEVLSGNPNRMPPMTMSEILTGRRPQ